MPSSTVIFLMALGIALLDAALVVKVLALFHKPSRAKIMQGNARFGLLAVFILSALSIIGSLYLQYGADLAPCLFCWWQRIFMYPLALISLVAILKNQKLSDIADYLLVLAVPGFVLALYQHFLQILPQGSLIPCDASDECAIRSVFEFHFVTLPWMAVTVFFAVILMAYLARRRS